MNTHAILGLLVTTGKISEQEADLIAKELSGKEMPNSWRGFLEQIEVFIGRYLYMHD